MTLRLIKDNILLLATYNSTAGTYMAERGVVNFGTKELDLFNNVTVGAGWNFLATAPGDYIVRGIVGLNSQSWVTTVILLISLRKGGVSQGNIGITQVGASYTGKLSASFNGIITLAAGEYFDIYEDSTGINASLDSTAGINRISVYRA